MRRKRKTRIASQSPAKQRQQQHRVLALFGKVDFDPKYDYKRLRKRT